MSIVKFQQYSSTALKVYKVGSNGKEKLIDTITINDDFNIKPITKWGNWGSHDYINKYNHLDSFISALNPVKYIFYIGKI